MSNNPRQHRSLKLLQVHPVETWQDQLARLRRAPWPTVIVGNEVGWSPVPAEPVLRRFRDLAGWTAQAAAEASDESWLLVAGCPLRLK